MGLRMAATNKPASTPASVGKALPTVGAGGQKAIVPSPYGVQQGKAFRGAVEVRPTDKLPEGVTASEWLVRVFAIGGPLWHTIASVQRLRYYRDNPRGGTVHVFDHAKASGDTIGCVAGVAEHLGCKATAPNKRDDARRWRGEGGAGDLPAMPDADKLAAIAAGKARHIANVAMSMYGCTLDSVLACPTFAALADAGIDVRKASPIVPGS